MNAQTLRDRYTLAQPCVVSVEPGGDTPPSPHTVWLRIGNQSFQLDGYCDTLEEAEWMRDQLGAALANLIGRA